MLIRLMVFSQGRRNSVIDKMESFRKKINHKPRKINIDAISVKITATLWKRVMNEFMHNETVELLSVQKRWESLTETERNKTEIIHRRFDTNIQSGDAAAVGEGDLSSLPTTDYRTYLKGYF